MRRKLFAGTTSFTISIVAYNSSTGTGLAGLTHTSPGLVLEYRRQGQSAWTSVPLVAGVLGTFVSGGIVVNGLRDGRYEISIPDAALANGARFVEVCLRGATNLHPVDLEFELDAVNYQDADGFGLSRLDAAIATRSTLTQIESSSILAKEATSQGIKDKTDNINFTIPGFIDVNLYRWGGTQPGNLDSNGFVPSNLASINGNTGRANNLSTILDNNYIKPDLATESYVSNIISNLIIHGDTEWSSAVDTQAIVSAVWEHTDRTLTSFNFATIIDTNNDKIDYLISGTINTLDELNTLLSNKYDTILGVLENLNIDIPIESIKDIFTETVKKIQVVVESSPERVVFGALERQVVSPKPPISR